MKLRGLTAFLVCFALSSVALAQTPRTAAELEQRFVQVDAKTREARTLISNLGMSIEFVRSDSAWGFADAETIQSIQASGIKILGNFDAAIGRGGHAGEMKTRTGPGFPENDSLFHDYAEVKTELLRLEKEYPDHAKVHVIGTSFEGREIYAIQLNTNRRARQRGKSNKPGAIFMGTHHAREHLSTEIPLKVADYLLANHSDPKLSALLDSRDIWFVPLVNPDGSEYDISIGNYRSWRKNRRPNADGTVGVDLNRNYGYVWGTGGSSSNPNSDVYMGTHPFSEPETQVMKGFVENHLNAKILLSFHTFSELILYPWGHTYEPIVNSRDLQVFETMAHTMAGWNRYTPQPSSELYITSGDTTDWAYGEHGIFAFTFELSPSSIWDGGFYPGQAAIEPTFAANLKPVLYMIEVADDPYRVLDGTAAQKKYEIHPY